MTIFNIHSFVSSAFETSSMATEHLDAFVQLATSHGLLDENQLKVTEHHVADQAQQLVLATEQKAKARLHDALAEAQSVYVPLLSEEAVQAQVGVVWDWGRATARCIVPPLHTQVELMRAVLDNLHTLLTEGKVCCELPVITNNHPYK